MLKKFGLLIFVSIVILLAVASTMPDSFAVKRSIAIKAPPEKIFAMIDDFHQWSAWSPWEKLDPAMKRMFSGPASGKGAVYAWHGNSDVGEGRMEIMTSTPTNKVLIKLDFISPFEGHNTAEYTLEPAGQTTRVTWDMYGPMPFVSKLMSVFVSMDTLIGKDFEAGLANLKAATEK